MKPKDIAGLVFAVVLLAVVGIIFYKSQVRSTVPAKVAATNSYPVVPVISDTLDPNDTIKTLATKYHVRDFKQTIDLKRGIGNTSIFGQ